MATATPPMSEDMIANINMYKRRISRCLSDIGPLHNITLKVKDDPSLKHLFLSKLSAARASLNEFNNSWDKLDACYVKAGDLSGFPTEEEKSARSRMLDIIHIAEAERLKIESETSPPASNSSASFLEASTIKSSLPKISLPGFSGNIQNWVHFRDTFKSIVHSEPSLKPVEKFHHLLSSLSGEALSHVSHLQPTDDNYTLAWGALIQAYDNKRVLAYSCLDRVLKFRFSKTNTTLSNLLGFITNVSDSISEFKSIQVHNPDDVILTYLALLTLDSSTRQKFELEQLGKEFPTVDDLTKFIRNGYQALRLSSGEGTTSVTSQSCSNPKYSHGIRFPSRSSRRYDPSLVTTADDSCSKTHARSSTSRQSNLRAASFKGSSPPRRTVSTSSRPLSPLEKNVMPCPFCQGQHNLLRCFSFAQLSFKERCDFVSKWKGCRNCLRATHSTKSCSSKVNCRYCGERHHSLLHQTDERAGTSSCDSQLVHIGREMSFNMCAPTSSPFEQVLLGTALVLIEDLRGKHHPARALIDPGSTRSFITHSCARRLRLPIHHSSQSISALGGESSIKVLGRVECNLHSRNFPQVALPIAALVINNITGLLPVQHVSSDVLTHFNSLSLADPHFGTPHSIDLLIGSDFSNHVINGTPQQFKEGLPFVTSTIFGDMVSGPVSTKFKYGDVSLLVSTTHEIQEQLKDFWRLEEPCFRPLISPEDEFAETHFKETFTRTSSGRFVVRFPFKDKAIPGDNRHQVKNRFLHLERRFSRDEGLRLEYTTFLREYEALGHMSKTHKMSNYLIPHHGVHKGSKIRVVFDGSCPSTTTSLNEQLLAGPKLQADVGDILLRFRLHVIAITTDIVKMYRQILIHPDERIFQHILWREHPKGPIEEYELNTVTYGLRSSAFQAIRSVKELASQEAERFPLASKCIQRDMFVDDLVTGVDSDDEALQLCQEVINCLACGGFNLDKWASNRPELLPHGSSTNSTHVAIEPEDTPSIKVLGLLWNPSEDSFTYSLNPPPPIMTKRAVLSTIARVFDPLGFLAPVVLTAKIFLQNLWLSNLDWDSTLPAALQNHWLQFIGRWKSLSDISISRYIPCKDMRRVDLVGFCDASSKAYAAVFYLRSESFSGEVTISLLKAKTKVAPVKFHTISRLELCGALLLARLYSSLNLEPYLFPLTKYFFTDSSVVLAWLRTPAHLLSVFEANRVTAINESTSPCVWFHVRSEVNPADIASRGVSPHEIQGEQLWWQGPTWLKDKPESWPIHNPFKGNNQATAQAFHTSSDSLQEPAWLLRFSRLSLLIRVVARIIKLLTTVRARSSRNPLICISEDANDASSWSNALNKCIKMVQTCAFHRGCDTPKLKSLQPFQDELGLLRVGGRLANAPVSMSLRHPIILPTHSHLTALIVDNIHSANFHSGPTLTLSILRTSYWISSAVRYIKGRIFRCVICQRRRPKVRIPVMAPLPRSRFEQIRPFLQVGIDFAGPFLLRDSLRRKPYISKAYLCLFVCMSTKALHLEAVSSLSTESFLATLDRFISRRGLPIAIHSDNATNFVGASRYLKDIYTFMAKNSATFSSLVAEKGIKWYFIPPYSPNFGGLWEAGVKSVKQLLPSSVGSCPMTYEELATIFIKIEALLNSRPLCPINEDPDTIDILTPGHFLIGSSLKALHVDDLSDVPSNRLSRWQLVQSRVQHIWDRWSKEYLHTLQQRHKWTKSTPNLNVGDLVCLQEKKNPLGLWPIARVVHTHPGVDGIVRVVTIRTATGADMKRPVSSLSFLSLPTS